MTRKILILLLLIASVSVFHLNAEDKPEATFKEKIIDFGRFTEKNPVHEAEFTIRNTGSAPLIIIKVRATCGCTTTSYSKAPIMPGKTGIIKVSYNGRNRVAGEFNKSIFVTTNASKDQVRLQIKGEMRPSSEKK